MVALWNAFVYFVNDIIWGPWLIVIILGMGVVALIMNRGFQFRFLGHIMKETLGKMIGGSKKANAGSEDSKGQLTPYQAISMAIGGAVGTGNIGGVATAIAVGGPGALLWLIIAALLGMGIKMMEVTLAVHYRQKNELNGEHYGGPTYYIQKGLGEEKGFKLWKIPAGIFAAGLLSTVIFTMTTYNVADAMSSTVGQGGLLTWGWIYSIACFLTIITGIKGVAKMAEKLVPIMCLFYVGAGLVVILTHFTALPGAIVSIFKYAFTPVAAAGGFAGATVSIVISTGIKRALYSNEAGWGTSPMIHASAKVDHPVKQGLWGAFEVFMDTCVVCTITGLVIIVTGMWDSGLSGAALTLASFETSIGIVGRWIIALSVFLFAYTTTGGWWCYNEILLRHMLGTREKLINGILVALKFVYPFAGLIVCYLVTWDPSLASGGIWVIGDLGSGIPTWMNLICLFFLAPKFRELVKDYKARYLGIGKVDPDFQVFYEEEK
ncbi:MAG: sodium:alanine symporter family protein [Firmicutes bacterium]|nr:sodium:alanine symporter family protein [Bacillota bacterium]